MEEEMILVRAVADAILGCDAARGALLDAEAKQRVTFEARSAAWSALREYQEGLVAKELGS